MTPEYHEMELEPGPPNHDDACMVCDKIECVCVPDCDFPSILQSAEDSRR